MIRLLIKLAMAALIANAAWRLGSAYMTYYRFKDAVTESAQFGGDKSQERLRQRILELASQYVVPVAEDEFSIRRDERNHTYIDGSYTQPVDLVPGYPYPWTFTWHIDVFVITREKLTPSAIP